MKLKSFLKDVEKFCLFYLFFFYALINQLKRKINLPRYHDSGRLRGYGHVTFKTKKGLTKALEKN